MTQRKYYVRAKLNSDDKSTSTFEVTAYQMETRYGGGIVFLNAEKQMVAYFSHVYAVTSTNS